MEWVEAWVRDHVSVARYEPSEDDARARELATWLRRDAAGLGISGSDIASAASGSISAGHGLLTDISDAMAAGANARVSEDF
jgi:hypothetical protein